MVKSKTKKTKGTKKINKTKETGDTGETGETGDSGDSEETGETRETKETKETKETGKPKKKHLSFSFGKKKEDAPEKQKGKLGQFFASINNVGMGKQRVSMVQSMSMMMNAGLPLIDTLSTLEREVSNRAAKKMVHKICAAVESGTPLWRSMQQQYLFTPYEIALVRIGEEAGSLAQNLEYLSIQQEKDRSLRAKVKMAMIYPTIVFVLMFVIVMGLGLFVLPNLIQVLLSLHADLPATTRGVIFITNLFSTYGTVAVPGMIAAFIVVVLLSKYTRFMVVSQWVTFRIPGIGTLGKDATIARFGVILGGLLRAGVPLVEALSSLHDVTNIVAYKKFYGRLLEHIRQGDSFSKSFSEIRGSAKLLPVSVQQLVMTGEQSGTLSATLLKIADIYEKKASETAEKLPVILEPMLLLFIGGLVGTIAFSIITPIYGVVGNVGR